MEKAPQTTLELGGATLGLRFDTKCDVESTDPRYRDFISEKNPEIIIRCRYDGMPDPLPSETDLLFDSRSIWKAYARGDDQMFVLRLPGSSHPYRAALIDSSFSRATIYTAVSYYGERNFGRVPFPLELPLGPLILMTALAQGRGIIAHAAGIDHQGKGYLFVGHSGHGKTTMAKLWKDHARVLNDDRIAVRTDNNVFRIYGLPWFGELPATSPKGVALDKIFFLRKAAENRSHALSSGAASIMLLKAILMPLWDKAATSFVLDFVANLVDHVSCYALDFVPAQDIVDYVRWVK